ncbi:MAG: hypothetical protein Q9221_007066 [Calogaya cf. arnoldii]
MAANRDERFLMRQRGAGTRDINLTFDLQLPGVPTISVSPLRPQKTGRSQPDHPNLRATRQTPKLTKATPKLVAKRTPATANNTTPRSVVNGNNVKRPETSKSTPASEAPRHASKVVSPKKRKIDQNLAEGATEDAEMPPVKRRKKRKSIGQDSIRKKTRAPALTKKTTQESKQRTRSKKLEEAHPETAELAAQKIPPASETPSASKTIQDPVQVLKVAQVGKEPKRRKRKSIGQNQRPKKTPRLAGQSTIHARPVEVEQQQIPIIADASTKERSQTVEEPKPQRRKRNAVTEKLQRRESPLLIMPSPPSATDISEALRGNPIPDQPIADIVAAEQPRKRGRKPNAAVRHSTEIPKEDPSVALTVLEVPTSQGEPQPQLGEVESKAGETSTVLKQVGKKRKPIGQTQKTKKSTTTRPLRAIDPNLNPASETRRTAATVSTPKPQGGSLSENSPILSSKEEQAQAALEPEASVPPPALKKRGRPKKAQAASPEHPTDIEPARRKLGHTVPMPDPAIRKRGRPKKTEAASQKEPAQRWSENEIPTPDPATKTRGWPKKAENAPQHDPTAIEPALRRLENEGPTSALAATKLGRPKKPQLAPQPAETAKTENMHDKVEPAKAPQERKGLVQKVTPASETPPTEVNQPTNRGAVLALPSRRRTKNIIKSAVQEIGSGVLPEVSNAASAEPEHRVLSPAPLKKRGRPKKQPTNPSITKEAPIKLPTSEPPRTKTQSNDGPPKLPPAMVPKLRAKPVTALPFDDDVDDDPLSECTPLQPTHKPKVNPVNPRTRIRRQAAPNPPNKRGLTVSDHSDLDEAPVMNVPKRRAKALDRELIPQEGDGEVVAHLLPREPQRRPDLGRASSSPRPQHQQNRNEDLESHIEQSFLEEKALKADLEELQAQRAQDIAEQRERDLHVHSERRSANIKKQARAKTDNHSQKLGPNKPMLGVKKKARGLGNLFRTVSGTRKGSRGDIDPDLQGILDQVRGVGHGGGGGGMTKIF